MPDNQQRRLVAIMFSDIVGYTSLMGDNEQKAIEILTISVDLHKTKVGEYNGKIIKELGDGLLSIFENATDAVQCAIEIQREALKNKIPIRIGIHEGEVIIWISVKYSLVSIVSGYLTIPMSQVFSGKD